ncbi:hypothetical protein FOB58_004247 [Candida parapsilosis]|uniref:SH3 domain-containing protein n=2 Tax=Candida parapsilosis TaxID=5480 RepID=G8BJK3_CANPC|nr:uncharacterized protein CPAR2_406220 [Candida parapsilosis]KAF6045810.1 hypothetical protein FOB58_004247 [Candida parapsilosis]KAF6046637.1 hypothetical protein FOB59_004102 [Candida parapsilosis]KAF6050922.1 hypothetical protein FOB60_003590 [Candida parapsilosis]KAF6062356.1 hypothetical protein FOB61_003786 [Candida parapsilosis]KAI5903307.1 hypothetical protein K4G60_g2462 [Candida parapsilosis]
MVVDALKSFSTNVGSHIKDAYKTTESEVTHFSHNFKDKVTFYHRDYDQDDELVKNYKHEIKQARSGLGHLISQLNQFYKRLVPHMMSLNIKVARDFQSLIGPDSLQFKDIEKYYHDFDVFQAEQEVPHVHPKERQFSIEGVNEELFQYLQSTFALKYELEGECVEGLDSTVPKIQTMRKRLKETLKLIKRRDRKREDQDRLMRKIDKLNQKKPPLSEKEEANLTKLQREFEEVDIEFKVLNDKTTTLLPHIMSFLDEFLESITKLLILKQDSIFGKIVKNFQYFATFYGFIYEEVPTYEAILNQWESDITSTRLQIESFITILQNSKTDLLNEEIDDEDKSSKTYKFYHKLSNKIFDKSHTVKPRDIAAGMFNDTTEADPIVSFEKYNNPQANQSETYHPRKILGVNDIVVEKTVGFQPELPPRPALASFKSMQSTAQAPSRVYYSQSAANSMESLSLNSDDDTVISDSSSVSSVPTHSLSGYTKGDVSVDKELRNIYNTSKNEIKVAPTLLSDFKITPDSETSESQLTDAYRLALLDHFYHKLEVLKRTSKIAKFDFIGVEVGDLSFKKGDTIEVVFDLQNVDTLYQQSNLNWLVGIIQQDNGHDYRIGFVPNNYV